MGTASPTLMLIDDYVLICNKLVERFCIKQNLIFDGWVGNEDGGIAGFASQYFFNISDIILDLKNKQSKGFILEWQSDGVDYNMFNEKQEYINYKSYISGLRYNDLKNNG